MNAVMLEHLSKTYPGGKKAVNQVSICLEPGEVFGFLGPNGAGKTTTVKLLNGMLTPTEGSCRIFGMDPARVPEQVHALSGVVTEHAQMYDHLTGFQNLMFYGAVFGMSRGESRRRGEALLTQLELWEAKDQKLSTYSTGMRQRLSLARALLHDPKILFLDEPTAGLDPESAQKVHGMIRRLAREKGITVFLCTHQLRYAQEICTRYGLMEQGRLLADGSLEELRSRVCRGMTVSIRARGVAEEYLCGVTDEGRALFRGTGGGSFPRRQEEGSGGFLRETGEKSGSFPRRQEEGSGPLLRETGEGGGSFPWETGEGGGSFLRKTGEDTYEAMLASEEEIPALVRRIVEAGGAVYHVSAEPPSLEDIYFALTTGKKEETPWETR